MSRVEEITEKLIQMMTAESEWVKTGIELEEVNNGIRRVAEGVATHVERLLAQEREKVREMCVKAVKELWREGEEMDERQRGYIRAVRDSTSTIRQLDLTKDLAASSREGISIRSFKDMAALDEGGEEKL